MNKFNMFITAVCVLFLIKLRWPKNKSIYDITKFKNLVGYLTYMLTDWSKIDLLGNSKHFQRIEQEKYLNSLPSKLLSHTWMHGSFSNCHER